MTRILVDADACPVKREIYRVAKRRSLKVILVANNGMDVPPGGFVSLQLVNDDFDAADDWIAEESAPGDVVITSDIPLAARCVKAGARVMSPKGGEFDEASIGDILATRDLLSGLREAGEVTGGPAPMTDRDRSRFLQSLETILQSIDRAR